MQLFVATLIALALVLPSGWSFADQTTAPGQQKKEAGAGSAKEFAPGQDEASHEKRDKEKGDKEKREKGEKGKKADKVEDPAKAKGSAKSGGKKK